MFETYKAHERYKHDPMEKVPTCRVTELPSDNQLLWLADFVKYGYPKPRDYGQIGGHARTAEPLKIALVDEDYEWKIAVENWFSSQLFIDQPFGLEYLLRQPTTQRGRFRLHYARFMLPSDVWRGEPMWSKYSSPYFFAYYINKDGERLFINETLVEIAYNADPISWHHSRRGYTIPEDWLSNRIDENRHKYDLFA